MKNNKKVILIPALTTFLLTFGSISSVAYFTAEDTVTNVFSAAHADIEIPENPETGPYDWGVDTKKVSIKNTSETMDGYVRAAIFPQIKNADGNIENQPTNTFTTPTGNKLAYGDIVLVLADNWSDNFLYKNGYFYYKNILKFGEITPELLQGVVLSETANKELYKDKTIDVEVISTIVQKESINKEDFNQSWSDIKINSDTTLSLK